MQPGRILVDRNNEFVVRTRVMEIGDVQLWDIASSPHEFDWTGTAGSQTSVISLALQLEGESASLQDGRATTLTPGSYSFFDWSYPHRRVFPTYGRTAVLRMPTNLLPMPRPAGAMLGTRYSASQGPGPLVSGVLRGIIESWPDDDRRQSSSLLAASIDLLSQLVAAHAQSAEGTSSRAERLVNAIKRDILTRLHDPTLSSQQIAEAHFMSLRQLHKLFEGTGETVASWVRTVRLNRVRADLADPQMHEWSIRDIGMRWGVTNPDTLTRSFTRLFGMSPREYRRSVAREGLEDR